MTTVEQDRQHVQADSLLDALRVAEANLRQSYFRMLEVVAELDADKVAASTGFGTTARLLAGVLNLSKAEARTRAEHAEVLTARRSLTGELLPARLPATAAELAAGAIASAVGVGPMFPIAAVSMVACFLLGDLAIARWRARAAAAHAPLAGAAR